MPLHVCLEADNVNFALQVAAQNLLNEAITQMLTIRKQVKDRQPVQTDDQTEEQVT